MKIVIATGIYPPEIGGPSFYVQSVEEALKRKGHDVRVILFGFLRQLPTGLRHLLYAIKLWWFSRGSDGILVFDTFSVAVPAGLVAAVSSRKVICRAGGDFVWETYIERTRDLVPFPEFYKNREKLNLKERIAFRLIRWALSHMHVAFSSSWQRDIWRDEYQFDPKRVHVIENAIEHPIASVPPTRKNFLFYARAIALKNHDVFRLAFEKAKVSHPEIELEEGQVTHRELLERIRTGYAVVLPSVSEVTPNVILESIRCGKPFLLTKYSGYADRFKEYGVLVDPLSVEDMARGIRELADPAIYEKIATRIKDFKEVHTYDDIADEYVTLLKRI